MYKFIIVLLIYLLVTTLGCSDSEVAENGTPLPTIPTATTTEVDESETNITSTQSISDIERAIVAICYQGHDSENIIGTGFIASPNGLIITADHVVYDSEKNTVRSPLYCLRPPLNPESDPSYYLLNLVKRYQTDPIGRDIAVLEMAHCGTSSCSFPFIPIAEPSEVGTEIMIAGYPLVFGKVLTSPLFRRGTIACSSYRREDINSLILDLGSIPGFSGSPVIDLQTNQAVGIVYGPGFAQRETDFCMATILYPIDIIDTQ